MNKNLILALILSVFLLTSCKNNYSLYDSEVYKKILISDKITESSTTVKEPNTYTTAYVSFDFCKIMKEPDRNSEILCEYHHGRQVDIIAKVDDWYSIKYEDTFAFLPCDNVSFNLIEENVSLILNLIPKGQSLINDVPIIHQFPYFPTGCEAVSAVMALNFLGEEITVDDFIDNYLPKSNSFFIKNGELYGPDPNEVYVGDPRSDSSFGCMSKPIEKALSGYLNDKLRVKRYENIPLEKLCAKYIDHNIPVLVWVTIAMIPSFDSSQWRTETGELFTWSANEHCMLMVGYDSDYYYMNDCYKGKVIPYPKEKTEIRYKELGCQAVVIEK